MPSVSTKRHFCSTKSSQWILLRITRTFRQTILRQPINNSLQMPTYLAQMGPDQCGRQIRLRSPTPTPTREDIATQFAANDRPRYAAVTSTSGDIDSLRTRMQLRFLTIHNVHGMNCMHTRRPHLFPHAGTQYQNLLHR